MTPGFLLTGVVMTTIAAKGGVVVADSQATGGFICRVKKIQKLKDGSIVGAAGKWNACIHAIDWLKGSRETEPPNIEDCEVMIVEPDGSIVYHEGNWTPMRFLDGFMAIGSGSMAAMAIMHHGGSAMDAVKMAAKLDDATSGPFHTLKLAAL